MVTLQVAHPLGHLDVKFASSSGTLQVGEDVNDANGQTLLPSLAVPGTDYVSVRFTIRTGPTPWLLDVFVDDAPVLTGKPIPDAPSGAPLSVSLYYGAYSAASGMTLHVDNVFLDPHD
jgi:hypothetical protein